MPASIAPPAGQDHLTTRLRALGGAGAVRLVVAATGGDERAVPESLTAEGSAVAIVNPKRRRDGACALGLRAKTDRRAAAVLAQDGRVRQPLATPLRAPSAAELGELLSYRAQLLQEIPQRQQQLTTNHIASLRARAEAHLDQRSRDRDTITAEIAKALKTQPDMAPRATVLRSCTGVGPILTATRIAVLPELGKITEPQIASLVGVAPFNWDSDTLRGQRIIDGGRANVRRVL